MPEPRGRVQGARHEDVARRVQGDEAVGEGAVGWGGGLGEVEDGEGAGGAEDAVEAVGEEDCGEEGGEEVEVGGWWHCLVGWGPLVAFFSLVGEFFVWREKEGLVYGNRHYKSWTPRLLCQDLE